MPQGLDHFEDEDTGTVFRDVIMLALLGFVAIVVLLLPHLKEPTKAEDNVMAPGNVIVEMRWPDRIPSDIDLWVQAPGDRPVGYLDKDGAIFNLLRDDWGHATDATQLNYEVSYTRGIPAGEYQINVHLYSRQGWVEPIPVTVAASIKPTPQASAKRILSTVVHLQTLWQEVTVFRFKIDEKGKLVAGSVHSLPRPLRGIRRPEL